MFTFQSMDRKKKKKKSPFYVYFIFSSNLSVIDNNFSFHRSYDSRIIYIFAAIFQNIACFNEWNVAIVRKKKKKSHEILKMSLQFLIDRAITFDLINTHVGHCRKKEKIITNPCFFDEFLTLRIFILWKNENENI